MIEAVRNLHALGAELEAALAAASTVPARIVGRADLGGWPWARPRTWSCSTIASRCSARWSREASMSLAGAEIREQPDVVARPAQAALRRAWLPATWALDSSPSTTTRLRPARLAS